MKKKHLLFAAVSLAALAMCGFIAVKTPAQTVAAESEELAEISQESSAEQAAEEPKQEEPTVSQWISDKIIPIVSGFSIANVVGIVVAIVTAISKARGDKKTSLEIREVKKEFDAFQKDYSEFIKSSNDLLEHYKLTFDSATTIMTEVVKSAKSMTDGLKEQNYRIENVENMKASIETACRLIAKSLALSDVAVKSGIAEDAQKLIACFTNDKEGRPDEKEG